MIFFSLERAGAEVYFGNDQRHLEGFAIFDLRHQLVAVFDQLPEAMACLEALNSAYKIKGEELELLIEAGDATVPEGF